MNIFERVNEDIKKAMLAKDKIRLTALRAAKSAFLLAQTESGDKEISQEREIQIIQKLVKQRNDSATIYKEQNRSELYEQEIAEAKILEEYLPEQISETEIRECVSKIIMETGASTVKDMGKIIGLSVKAMAGKADNKIISQIAKELLT